MEVINELELRRLIKESSPQDLTRRLVRDLLNPSISWEEKRPLWQFLYHSGREATLLQSLVQALKAKLRIPYDIVIELTGKADIKPTPLAIEGTLKGLKKQEAFEDLMSGKAWDRFDKRISLMRNELLEKKVSEKKQLKDNLFEKFEFLKNQRMNEQAGRVLRRMIELYPEEKKFQDLKQNFEEEWARNVLSTHLATLDGERWERTLTAPSGKDQEMIKCFFEASEKICIEMRELAPDIAIIFWFLEEYEKALEVIQWAPVTKSNDWLKAEILLAARHFIAALEHINQLEVKYVDDPETTFAASYARAQCLHALGQHASALEIMKSIVRVRPSYRSANALIQEWTEGGSWE